ncbi:MAG TPA: spore coat protein CotJB [Firmicutes bacterium]|nr:spore coat protein CotJB [Bacillota bacterium]
MDEQRRNLLRQIMALEFTAIELTLFLDTHPDDTRALADFNAAAQELGRLKNMYESLYGPLLSYGFSSSPDRWRWIEEPWPWQISA